MQKHSQIVAAETQLALAQDAYRRAVDSLDRQYVKPLARAVRDDSDEAAHVAELRARYFEFSVEPEAVEGDVESNAAAKSKPKGRAPRARKEQQ